MPLGWHCIFLMDVSFPLVMIKDDNNLTSLWKGFHTLYPNNVMPYHGDILHVMHLMMT